LNKGPKKETEELGWKSGGMKAWLEKHPEKVSTGATFSMKPSEALVSAARLQVRFVPFLRPKPFRALRNGAGKLSVFVSSVYKLAYDQTTLWWEDERGETG